MVTNNASSPWLERIIRRPRFLPRCFFAYMAVRLVVVVFVPVQPSSDAGWYLTRATELARGLTYSEGGTPTAYWPVGYPGMLGYLFSLTGPSLTVAKLANAGAGAVSFWCLYFLVRRLFDEDTARASLVLLAVYPNNIAYTPLILTEYLFTALLLAGALFCSWKTRTSLLAAGLVFGLATLVKTQTILLGPVLALGICWEEWHFRSFFRAAARAVLVGIVALVVVAPWTWRNYETFGTFILVSTNGGMSLLAGNNPSVVGDYANDFSEADPLIGRARWSVADQAAADQRARTLASEWIHENPMAFISMVPKKIFRLWAPDGEAEWQYQGGTPGYDEMWPLFRTVRLINQAFYTAAIGLFAWAFFRLAARRASPDLFAGYLLALTVTALCILFSGQSRYHFPVMPFVFAYVAWLAVGTPPAQRTSSGSGFGVHRPTSIEDV